MRGNHPGEGKREQQPERLSLRLRLGPKWSSPGWEHPGTTAGWGTAVALQGCPILGYSEHPPGSPSAWDGETDQ